MGMSSKLSPLEGRGRFKEGPADASGGASGCHSTSDTSVQGMSSKLSSLKGGDRFEEGPEVASGGASGCHSVSDSSVKRDEQDGVRVGSLLGHFGRLRRP